MIYFYTNIKCPDRIIIGYTLDKDKRLDYYLKCQFYPEKTECKYLTGDMKYEKQIHQTLKSAGKHISGQIFIDDIETRNILKQFHNRPEPIKKTKFEGVSADIKIIALKMLLPIMKDWRDKTDWVLMAMWAMGHKTGNLIRTTKDNGKYYTWDDLNLDHHDYRFIDWVVENIPRRNIDAIFVARQTGKFKSNGWEPITNVSLCCSLKNKWHPVLYANRIMHKGMPTGCRFWYSGYRCSKSQIGDICEEKLK